MTIYLLGLEILSNHLQICRPAYFKLIAECVSQIVLCRSGVDPDFRAHQRFQIDVDSMIGVRVSNIIF